MEKGKKKTNKELLSQRQESPRPVNTFHTEAKSTKKLKKPTKRQQLEYLMMFCIA